MTARLLDLRPVYVAGVGLHRYQKPTDTPYTDLALAAVRAALADAGIAWPSVETAVCGTANLGMAAGWTALRHLGATGIPVMQVENASATGSTAFRDIVLQVASGIADCGLALGVDKMARPRLAALRAGTPDLVRGAAPPVVGFALQAKRHMQRHGTTLDQLAFVSVKNHWNGARNPNAQFQRECTRLGRSGRSTPAIAGARSWRSTGWPTRGRPVLLSRESSVDCDDCGWAATESSTRRFTTN